jgi:hypothetical protein
MTSLDFALVLIAFVLTANRMAYVPHPPVFEQFPPPLHDRFEAYATNPRGHCAAVVNAHGKEEVLRALELCWRKFMPRA